MSAAPHDLLIVGAGDLGRRVAALWQQAHPGARVVGETATTRTHAVLEKEGITPALSGAGGNAPNVVFCVPPSRFDDYAAAIAQASQRVLPNGRFVLTSSSGVHGDAIRVDESTPPADTPRAVRLFAGERAALTHDGGIVVRLSGLYFGARGPHTFFLRPGPDGGAGVVPGPAESEINLLHYDDAASAVIAALHLPAATLDALPRERRVFLAAVRDMMSRQTLVEAALKMPMFAGRAMPTFQTPPGAVALSGRVYDSSWSRATLRWAPRWENYADFVADDGMRKESRLEPSMSAPAPV